MRFEKIWRSLLVVSLIVFPFSYSYASSAATPPQPRTFSALTLNVQFLTFPTTVANMYLVSQRKRAKLLVQNVLNDSGPDIVVLNECFSDTCQDAVMSAAVSPLYITRFTHIFHRSANLLQDSGLAILSKFPLADIAQDLTDPFSYSELCARGNLDLGNRHFKHAFDKTVCLEKFFRSFAEIAEVRHLRFSNFDRLAAHPFDTDSQAEKGVGFVRLKNPTTQRDIDIYFAHLQSGFSERASTVRKTQLESIQDSILAHSFLAPGTHVDNTDILFMGDLNVAGEPPGSPLNASEVPGFWDTSHRWSQHIARSDSDLNRKLSEKGRYLWDLWWSTNPEHDTGETHSRKTAHFGNRDYWNGTRDDEARFDYLLLSAAPLREGGLCAQSIFLDESFSAPEGYPLNNATQAPRGGLYLTDHFGVHAIFGPTYPGCRVRDAIHVEDVRSANAITSLASQIPVANGFQWFELAPGTYTARLMADAALSASAFSGSDVTHALPLHEAILDEKSRSFAFSASERLFFRVGTQETPALYEIQFLRHQGVSFDEALDLETPGIRKPLELDPDAEHFIRITPRTLSHPGHQVFSVDLGAEPSQEPNIAVSVIRRNEDRLEVLHDLRTGLILDSLSPSSPMLQDGFSLDNESEFFVRVSSTAPLTLRLNPRYDTDLRSFSLINLLNLNNKESGWFSNDQIRLRVLIKNASGNTLESFTHYCGAMDKNSPCAFPDANTVPGIRGFTINFLPVDTVDVELWEDRLIGQTSFAALSDRYGIQKARILQDDPETQGVTIPDPYRSSEIKSEIWFHKRRFPSLRADWAYHLTYTTTR
ncbi:hypothetical protein WDW86_08815 [Bdellovibrionota bacterium FG-2]